MWYLAWNHRALPGYGAEADVFPPQYQHTLFMAKAWVLGAEPGELEGCLDLPWQQRGDLYYIHKLAETVRAHRAAGGKPRP